MGSVSDIILFEFLLHLGTSRILSTYKVMPLILLTSLILIDSLPTSMLSSTAIIVFDNNFSVTLSLYKTKIVSSDDKIRANASYFCREENSICHQGVKR